MFVAEILKTKGNAVFSIAPNLTVTQACAELEQKRVGALVVCDGDRVVGVFSERDVVKALAAAGAAPSAPSSLTWPMPWPPNASACTCDWGSPSDGHHSAFQPA